MSAPLTKIILSAGVTNHVLHRARLEEIVTETDLQAFRAPYGKRWHRVGTGYAQPDLLPISGAVEAANLALAEAALKALLTDLPAIDTLNIGTWALPAAGTVGPVTITPTLRGYRMQLTVVRA